MAPVMTLRTLQAAPLRTLMEVMSQVVDDVNIEFSEDGATMCTLDTAHVSLVYAEIMRAGLEVYECVRPVTLGISTSSLAKALKGTNVGDQLLLVYDDDSPDRLLVCVENAKRKACHEFCMFLRDIDTERMQVPTINYPLCVRLSPTEFSKMIKDASGFGQEVTIKYDSGADFVRLDTQGDAGVMTAKIFRQTDEEECEEPPRKKARTDVKDTQVSKKDVKDTGTGFDTDGQNVCEAFSLSYLMSFTKAANLTQQVLLYLAPSLPIQLLFSLENIISLRTFIAPKVDDDAG